MDITQIKNKKKFSLSLNLFNLLIKHATKMLNLKTLAIKMN